MMDLTATQMLWQPRLLRLTSIGHPDIDGGEAGACFVRPDLIAYVQRSWATQKRIGDGAEIPIPCTIIVLQSGVSVSCEESPERVAAMRDKELGHARTTLAPVDVDTFTGPEQYK